MTVVRFAAALGIALLMAQAVFAGWVAAGPAGDINGQVEGMTAQNDPVAGAINAVLADPTNANILYVGAVNGGIWKTYQNWQDLIVSDSGQVYRSLDGGNSFSNITGNLAGVNLHTVAIADVGATQFILVGADDGVFCTTSSSLGTWTQLGATTLPNAPVWDLHYDPTDDVLVAATLGRGAFEFNNFSTTVPEPSTLALLGIACLGMIGYARHRRRRNANC